MALFNRKNVDPKALPEVEKYYEAEKRERMGLAWVLAVVSIACVVILLIGAFFGGRWVYRKATHDDKKAGVATTSAPKSEITQTKDTSDTDTEKPSTKTPSTTAPSTPTPKPTTPAVPKIPIPKPTTPSTTTPPKTLVNTGPANTAAVFMISALGFAGLHNFLSRRLVREN
jgi:cytoskeletal protein RodZ